jgi:hypothetical protein
MLVLAPNGCVAMIRFACVAMHLLATYFTDVNDSDTAEDSLNTLPAAPTAAASHAQAIAISSPPRSDHWSWIRSSVRWLFFLLVLLAPVSTAGEAAAVATATFMSYTTINTTTVPINTWTSLASSIKDAAGKTTTLTLSASCSGYTAAISIDTAHTNVTIIGNGATFYF